ncbi:hypothetical protein E3Q16_03669 [Wallemia mellicola]|nr:hypothetical protein E3Q16_03669 [Wallemia mellicola]TIC08927.1 hypothetical protein E3Q14_03665 [Wallemia mellicola]
MLTFSQGGQADTLITGLRDRLKLRLELLSLYNPNRTNCPVVTQQGADNVSLASINTALGLIPAINACPAPSVTAKRAFYADISKYLPNMAPLPPLDESLLQIEGTNVWEGFRPSLESMKDINKAICNQDPLEWINWTSFKSIITPENKTLPAYVRNLVLSRFITDENLIFDQHSIEWITDKLLEDTIGLPFGMVGLIGQLNRTTLTVVRHSEMSIGLAFQLWSQRLAGFYVNLLTTYCHNRSRQKRNIPKSIKQFQELYEEALTFIEQSAESVETLSPTLSSLIRQIPFVIRSFILSLNIEALLVSTELELLDSEHDWTIIYWQLRRVAYIWQQELYDARSKLNALPVDERVGFTDNLKRNAEEWMKERTKYANLIELLSKATLNVSIYSPAAIDINIQQSFFIHKLPESLMTQPERQARFERRLKWCMRGNIDSDGSLETDPKYTQYEIDLNDLQKSAVPEETLSYYKSSVERIDELLELDVHKVKCSLSKDKRYNLLQSLRQICEVNISNFSNTSAAWSNDIHPWYPNIS